ncbi:MAG: hypothetical protein OEZ32_09820 [Nitrospinota bacterium]|nr:hypothetical protein [Nitrospinota bacterium]
MARNGKYLSRIHNMLGEQMDYRKERTIDGASLRSEVNDWGEGMEIVMPDGKALCVVEDDVGKTIWRVRSLFAGKSLKVVGLVDFAGVTIKLKKVEAFIPKAGSPDRRLAMA